MKTLTTAAKYILYRPDVDPKGHAGWPEFSREEIAHLHLSEAEFRAVDGGASVQVRENVFVELSQAEVWEDLEPEIVAVEKTEADHGETGSVRVTVLADNALEAAETLRRYGYRIDREDRHLLEECTGRAMITGLTSQPTDFEGKKAFIMVIGWALDI